MSRDKSPEKCCLIMGLAATTEMATLWLYVLAEKCLWALCIIKDIPWNELLLAVTSIAITSLCNSPVIYRALKTPVPFKEVIPMKNNAHCRVFLDKKSNEIIKVFCRSDDICISNVDLMMQIGIPVTTKDLTVDGEYFYIKYPFYPGDNKPKTLKQFRGIVSMLDKVHKAGYVHCDVRIPNLIFGKNGTDSYLIDYDLARKNKVGRYPHGYNSNEILRHPDAEETRLVNQKHDRHS